MSTPFARNAVGTSPRPRLAQWTLSRAVATSIQILFLAAAAGGHLTRNQFIIGEVAAAILSLGLAEAMKSMPERLQNSESAQVARGLTAVGIQCAVVVFVMWIIRH